MNLPSTAKQEHLGVAYVRAVVAKAGCTTTLTEGGADFGIDLVINNVGLLRGKPRTDGARIDVQIKSTYTAEIRDGKVIYDLEAKDYDTLRRKRLVSRILILFRMPELEADWLHVADEATTLRHCAYWHTLPGDDELTENKATKRIAIPAQQIFDAPGLIALMTRVTQGEVL